ncbi:efflux RND transporter periplasmic adaptor subunit [candidate division GN15 bacterium]|nr:efflux RND transporter periplasmic adaptor subunit [candidate division GN15 bacterium]
MQRLHKAAGPLSPAIILVFLFLTTPLILTSCSDEAGGSQGRGTERLIPAVEAVQARHGSLPLTERLSGKVRARNQVELYPEVSAVVTSVYAENGDLVNEGDPLIQLRDTEFRERLKQAEADLQIARAQAKQAEAEHRRMQSELRRATRLSEQDLISPTEFETIQTQAVAAEADAELARARVEQAEATVEERREALARTTIRAPVGGTVGNRRAEVGMLVTPNTRVYTLGKMDSVIVEVVLTDRMLAYIKEDQRSQIMGQTLPGGSMSAPLSRISPFLHPVTHSTTAEIDLANPDRALKPGMFVTVDIFYGESDQATLVPLSSLWENPATSVTGVFVSRGTEIGEPVAMLEGSRPGGITEPVGFEFVPVNVVAKGRLSAGVTGIDSGRWVVTIGQDLLGSDTGSARVRPVDWEWVEKLQQLQREDLLDEIIRKQQTNVIDTPPPADTSRRTGGTS